MIEQLIHIVDIIVSSQETADILKDVFEAYNDIKEYQDQLYDNWFDNLSEDGRGCVNYPGQPIEHAHDASEWQSHFHTEHTTDEGKYNICWVNVKEEDYDRTKPIVSAMTASQNKLVKNSKILKMLARHNQGTVHEIYQKAWKKVEKKKRNSRDI